MLQRVPTRIVHDELLELGEGPTYDPETNTAFWFDIIGKGLYEMPLSDEVIVTRHPMPVMASEIAVVDAATQIVAAEDGLYLRERASRWKRTDPTRAPTMAVSIPPGRSGSERWANGPNGRPAPSIIIAPA